MQRNPSAEANPNGGNLFLSDPHPGQSSAPLCRQTECRKRFDQYLLESPEITDHVTVSRVKPDYWIANELAGTVVSNLSAARYPVNRNTLWIEHEPLIGAAP